MEFREKLQLLRKENKLTQNELAEKLFVSRSAISKWETGNGYPNLDSLQAISNIFDITINELLSGEEIIKIAKVEHANKVDSIKSLSFIMIDFLSFLVLFIPLYCKKTADGFITTTLFECDMFPFPKYFFLVLYIFVLIIAVAELICYIQKFKKMSVVFWISIILTFILTVAFIAVAEIYVAFLFLVLLFVKVVSNFSLRK